MNPLFSETTWQFMIENLTIVSFRNVVFSDEFRYYDRLSILVYI